MNVPEIQFEIVKNLSLQQIRLSYPDLLKQPYVWKMLLQRDFPLATEHKEYKSAYEHFEKLFHRNNRRQNDEHYH